MRYCPLMSFQKQYTSQIPCLEEECALAADGAGDCLIKQALQCYVAAERTKAADEAERLRKETEAARLYWATKKDGTRSPIQFLENVREEIYTPPSDVVLIDDSPQIDGYDTPVAGGITYAHITPTEKYPHGGWFEDLSPIQDLKYPPLKNKRESE